MAKLHLIKEGKALELSYDTKRRLGFNDSVMKMEAMARLARDTHEDCHKCGYARFEDFKDAATLNSHYRACCVAVKCQKAEWSLKTGPIIEPPKPPSESELQWLIDQKEQEQAPIRNDIPKVAEAGAW